MISQCNFKLTLAQRDLDSLTKIAPWEGSHWDTPPNDDIGNIKNDIRRQLELTQTKCSYCGLKLKGTSKGEIEHIAAKAYYRHPEFTFTLKNLTLACNWCNRPEKKGNKETISVKRANYDDCEFLLVHPYLDNPEEHYEWTDNTVELLIQVRDDSPKAIFSIAMFELDTPEMNEHRAAQLRFEELKAKFPLSKADEELIELVTSTIVK